MWVMNNTTIMLLCSIISLVFAILWSVHGWVFKTKHKIALYISAFNFFTSAGILAYGASSFYKYTSYRLLADILLFTGLVFAHTGILSFFELSSKKWKPAIIGSIVCGITVSLFLANKFFASNLWASTYMLYTLYKVMAVIEENLQVKDIKTKNFIVVPLLISMLFLLGRPLKMLLYPEDFNLDIFTPGLFNTYLALGFLVSIFCLNSTFFGMTLSTLMLKARNSANSDYLTGLYNRRFFQNSFKHEEAYKLKKYSLMLIDIDFFKKINDTLGHNEGDNFLIEFAKVLTTCVDKFKIKNKLSLARIGGEEFGIAIDTTSELTLTLLAQEIHDCLKNTKWKVPLQSPATVSIGIAIQEDSEEFLDVFKKADSALYQSKNTGRNKTSFYNLNL